MGSDRRCAGALALALMIWGAGGACEAEHQPRDEPEVDAAAAGAPAPPAPIDLRATPFDGALAVDWSYPSGDADAFRVWFRANMPGPPWDGQASSSSPLEVGGDARTATVLGLQNDQACFVAVSARVGERWSEPSEWVSTVPRRDATSMVFVPAGVFRRGAEPFLFDPDEEPARAIYLDAFWQDRYAATNAEYRACLEAGACPPPAAERGFIAGVTEVDDYFTNPLYDDYPVVFLEYEAARAYCAWQDKRLPTEAEWERAAKGPWGHERSYPWGDEPPSCERANFSDDGLFCVGGPLPVGALAANNVSAHGALELAGNVWEWTADWYAPDAYEHAGCRNPKGPPAGTQRVLRGGAWYYPASALSVVYRNQWEPALTFIGDPFQDYQAFGVRCVKDSPGVPCDPASAQCELPAGTPCPELDVEPGPDPGVLPDADSPLALDTEDAGDEDAWRPRDRDADARRRPDVAPLADAQGEEVWVADADAAPDDDSVEDIGPIEPEPDAVVCGWPQDLPVDPSKCTQNAPPTCPSGWPLACAEKTCACSANISTEVDPCGEPPALALTLGWRDAALDIQPFVPGQPYEMCQGFQGGFHLSVFAEIEGAALADAPATWTGQVVALADIGGVKVGGVAAPNLPFHKQANGRWRSPLMQVVFESCQASYFVGQTARVSLLVRRPDGTWGRSEVELQLIDDVQGPFLDPAQTTPC